MYSNKKFGLSDSLIEAARKVAEATSVPVVKKPSPEEEEKKENNKRKFYNALTGKKKTLVTKEEQEINELAAAKYAASVSSMPGGNNAAKSAAMNALKPTFGKPAGSAAKSAASNAVIPNSSTPKETPHDLVKQHQGMHKTSVPSKTTRPFADKAKDFLAKRKATTATSTAKPEPVKSKVVRKSAIDAPIEYREKPLPSGDTKATVPVSADSPPKQTSSVSPTRKTGTLTMGTKQTVSIDKKTVAPAKTTKVEVKKKPSVKTKSAPDLTSSKPKGKATRVDSKGSTVQAQIPMNFGRNADLGKEAPSVKYKGKQLDRKEVFPDEEKLTRAKEKAEKDKEAQSGQTTFLHKDARMTGDKNSAGKFKLRHMMPASDEDYNRRVDGLPAITRKGPKKEVKEDIFSAQELEFIKSIMEKE